MTRYQKGSLIVKGKREPAWYFRWLEDRPENGQMVRVHRSERLGSLNQMNREQAFVAGQMVMNGWTKGQTMTRADVKSEAQFTLSEFIEKWREMILPQHKPSSQNSEKCHLTLIDEKLGALTLKDVSGEVLQRFVSQSKAAPKTTRNQIATFRCVWKTAKAWGYVTHNPFDALVLPRLNPEQQPCYSAEQIRQIISEAQEPYRTMFWLVAETGMRGGEVCGLAIEDMNLEARVIRVRRSAWRGRLQAPKTANAVRTFPISEQLAEHLREFTAGRSGLVFVSRNSNPLDNYSVVRFVLRPITDRLGFAEGGLHAFRHANATVMDQMNVPIAVRRERLGHAQFTTTLGYTHAISEDHKRVAEILGKNFCPSCP